MSNQASLLPVTGYAYARDCLAAGRPACVVRVQAVQGSVPRETDAVLIVDDQSFGGTIGGGHLEHEAIAVARGWLVNEAHKAEVLSRRFPLGPSLGQCCGGAVELRFSRLLSADLPSLQALDAKPDEVWLYGAGHVAKALVYALLPLPFRIHWVDTRDDLFPPDLPDQVVLHPSDAPADEVALAAPGAFHLVMTHSHALDFDVVQAVLDRRDAAYCGLIGSQTKRVTFERRLLARGLPAARLEELICPVGIAGVEGKLPAVIAVAVAAQLLSWSKPGADAARVIPTHPGITRAADQLAGG